MRKTLLCVALALFVPSAAAQERPPFLDMHLHALAATLQGLPPLGMCDEEVMSQTVTIMVRRNRVMFGSDQMVWPGVLDRAITVIEEAPFLRTAQKRALLYDNAARFLRLSDEEIARHRRM